MYLSGHDRFVHLVDLEGERVILQRVRILNGTVGLRRGMVSENVRNGWASILHVVRVIEWMIVVYMDFLN